MSNTDSQGTAQGPSQGPSQAAQAATQWADSRRCPNCGALNDQSAEWCGQCLAKFPDARPAVDYESAVRRALRAGEAAERQQQQQRSKPPASDGAAPTGTAVPAGPAASDGLASEMPDPTESDEKPEGVSVTYKVHTYVSPEGPSNAASELLSKVGTTAAELGLLPLQRETDDSFSLAFKIEKGALSWRCSTCDSDNPIREHVCSVCGTPFKKAARHFADQAASRRQQMTALDTAGTLVAFSPLGLPLRLLALGLSALGRIFLRRPRT